jgi:predicted transcriptional regulator
VDIGYFNWVANTQNPKAKRQKKDGFLLKSGNHFSFMEIIGRDKLAKWEHQEIKKSNKAHYGISITKKKLFNDLYDLNPYEKIIYFGLRLYADKEGHCWPSMRELAGKLNLTIKTIQKYIHTLKKKGFLKIEIKKGRGGKRFEYWLLK